MAKVGVIGLGGQSAFMSVAAFPLPGETVSCKGLFFELGGKGYNQAVAAARMGVETVFVGAIGDDVNGRLCHEDLKAEHIRAYLLAKQEPTAYAVITTEASGENTVQVFGGAAQLLTPDDIRAVEAELASCDYLLLQNELPLSCLREAVAVAREHGIPVVLNPAPAGEIPEDILCACSLITPNYGEAEALAGFSVEDHVTPEAFVSAFSRKGIRRAVITMGAEGALLIDDHSWEKIPSVKVGTAVDTTGAGDTFSGTLTACLAQGMQLRQACFRAAAAAGIAVTRRGARGSIPFLREIEALL